MSAAGDQARREKHLVAASWLRVHLDDPAIRIVDMRGRVRTWVAPDGGEQATYEGARAGYEQGHIPGATYIDWTRDIVDESDPVPAQVAPPEKLERLLSQAGIGDEHLVVAYDTHPASQFATRLWWVLRYYGHQAVRVLNGGFGAWTRASGPVTGEIPRFPAARFTARAVPRGRATAEEVAALIRDSGAAVVDARDEGQYTGRVRRDRRAGRIPGAISLPRERLLDPEGGEFLSSDEIRARVEAAGIRPDRRVIAYCNGGVASTSVLFALSMLGYPDLTNYDGSWNEWGNRDDLPVEGGIGGSA